MTEQVDDSQVTKNSLISNKSHVQTTNKLQSQAAVEQITKLINNRRMINSNALLRFQFFFLFFVFFFFTLLRSVSQFFFAIRLMLIYDFFFNRSQLAMAKEEKRTQNSVLSFMRSFRSMYCEVRKLSTNKNEGLKSQRSPDITDRNKFAKTKTKNGKKQIRFLCMKEKKPRGKNYMYSFTKFVM